MTFIGNITYFLYCYMFHLLKLTIKSQLSCCVYLMPFYGVTFDKKTESNLFIIKTESLNTFNKYIYYMRFM